jgi:hypothetical protein
MATAWPFLHDHMNYCARRSTAATAVVLDELRQLRAEVRELAGLFLQNSTKSGDGPG